MRATPSRELPALRVVVSLEDQIRKMRKCHAGCPMVKTLDQRIENQRKLVEKLLETHGLKVEDLLRIPLEELDRYPTAVQLCYHILRDCDYIDSLR